jgi:hypothetical protein
VSDSQIERLADYTPANRQVDPTPYPTDYTSQLTTLGTRMTAAETGLQTVTYSYNSNRNRIVNGEFAIDQRNQGGLYTNPVGYFMDRWNFANTKPALFNVRRNLNNVTPPPGFTSYFGAICTTAQASPGSDYVLLLQAFERQQIDDFNFGTTNAVPITFSFWVYVSNPGVYSGSMRAVLSSPSLVFTYTVAAASTWQYVSIVIPPPTTNAAAWTSANPTDRAADIMFSLLLGSSYSVPQSQAYTWLNSNLLGHTNAVNVASAVGQFFFVTGVQLEKGSVATSFDRRPISVEFAMCQRWLIVHGGPLGVNRALTAQVSYFTGNSITFSLMAFPQPMRIAPIAVTTGAPAVVLVSEAGLQEVQWDSPAMSLYVAFLLTCCVLVCLELTSSFRTVRSTLAGLWATSGVHLRVSTSSSRKTVMASPWQATHSASIFHLLQTRSSSRVSHELTAR